jgi:hypothetical protein
MEIVDIMTMQRLILCAYKKPSGVSEKAKELDVSIGTLTNYKVRSRNEIGIIVDNEWKNDIMNVK